MESQALSSTRTLVVAEWEAAKAVAGQRGALHGSVGTVAGQYLELARGDAQVAATLVPMSSVFFERVREVLLSIHRDEREASRSNVVSIARAKRVGR